MRSTPSEEALRQTHPFDDGITCHHMFFIAIESFCFVWTSLEGIRYLLDFAQPFWQADGRGTALVFRIIEQKRHAIRHFTLVHVHNSLDLQPDKFVIRNARKESENMQRWILRLPHLLIFFNFPLLVYDTSPFSVALTYSIWTLCLPSPITWCFT